jgi:AcrR family transcriptional regulator
MSQTVTDLDGSGSEDRPEGISPAGDETVSTRERILDVALDLFTEKGYDSTSLREIAERVGVTKAALYYHFASKDDILMALHMRLHELGRDALDRMTGKTVTIEMWAEVLDSLLDQVLAQRKIFLFHERNQAALEKLHSAEHDAENADVQDKFRQILADPAIPFPDRVRMACSMGAMFFGSFAASDALEAVPDKELGDQLRSVLRGILND